jgi:hypothetical protein
MRPTELANKMLAERPPSSVFPVLTLRDSTATSKSMYPHRATGIGNQVHREIRALPAKPPIDVSAHKSDTEPTTPHDPGTPTKDAIQSMMDPTSKVENSIRRRVRDPRL